MTKVPDYRLNLKNMIRGEVLLDEELRRHTSIGVGGEADCLILPENREELRAAVLYLLAQGIPFIPVGNWTNLIVRDAGYRGALISTKGLRDLQMEEKAGALVCIHAGAGMSLMELVNLTMRESLSGMEFCAGIPGSIGGAVCMNAGAFGREMKDILSRITVLNGSGTFRDLPADELSFSYRNLALPEGTVITGASLLTTRGNKQEISAMIGEIIELRKKKHPLDLRNAGSIFKNPKGLPAGRIIEELGLKGMQVGGAKISEKHGNFIVNVGDARADDILALIDIVQKRVREERGITLETEVRIIGD